MAKDKTIQAVRTDVESHGFSIVPMATVEYILGITCTDDDAFEAAVCAAAAGLTWIVAMDFDWINRAIMFKGPMVPA